MSFKALVIGCGNIGSGYDFSNDQVLTHAKAFRLNPEIEFSVADVNEKAAIETATKYGVRYYTRLSDEELKEFNIISLCTSTKYHFEYLKRISGLSSPFIICEKPVVATLNEVNALRTLEIDPQKILVNYIRRFQPGYHLLKHRLAEICHVEQINLINLKYHRGLLNSASHGLDLLTFLLEREVRFDEVQMLSKGFDAFETDPTIIGSFLLNGIPVMLQGFIDSMYSIFEMEIYTKSQKILIENSGDTIKYYKNVDGVLVEDRNMRQEEVLKDYMVAVVEKALSCMKGNSETNFSSALQLNEEVLKLIETIK
jgi:predicted dehydrogenase